MLRILHLLKAIVSSWNILLKQQLKYNHKITCSSEGQNTHDNGNNSQCAQSCFLFTRSYLLIKISVVRTETFLLVFIETESIFTWLTVFFITSLAIIKVFRTKFTFFVLLKEWRLTFAQFSLFIQLEIRWIIALFALIQIITIFASCQSLVASPTFCLIVHEMIISFTDTSSIFWSLFEVILSKACVTYLGSITLFTSWNCTCDTKVSFIILNKTFVTFTDSIHWFLNSSFWGVAFSTSIGCLFVTF